MYKTKQDKNKEFCKFIKQQTPIGGISPDLIKYLCREYHILIFSGIIRDFFLSKDQEYMDYMLVSKLKKIKVHDIDIVYTDTASGIKNDEYLKGLLKDSNIIFKCRNNFGGMKFDMLGFEIDAWPMDKTSGILISGKFPSVDSLINTTFFNFANIVYDVFYGEFYYGEYWERFLFNKNIDIIYDNIKDSRIKIMFINTIDYTVRLNLKLSQKAIYWLHDNYKDNNYQALQLRKYGKERYSSEFIDQFMKNLIINEI